TGCRRKCLVQNHLDPGRQRLLRKLVQTSGSKVVGQAMPDEWSIMAQSRCTKFTANIGYRFNCT
ncbi:MAG TPA: hypothetical protein VFW73_07325, partial [Lacipirellulaceae bacterium]|nr:hypothetical protein [Lacipirellulaceae bacterium]